MDIELIESILQTGKQCRLGCYMLNCDHNTLDSDEQRAAYAIKFGTFYDFSIHDQLQNACDRLIKSININSNLLMGYEFNGNNISENILANQIISSWHTLSEQIYILDNNKEKLKPANIYNFLSIFCILHTNPLFMKFIMKHSGKQLLHLLIYVTKYADCRKSTHTHVQYDKPHQIAYSCWSILSYSSYYWKSKHFKYAMKHTFHWLWHMTVFEYWSHRKDYIYSLWQATTKFEFNCLIKEQFKAECADNARPDSHFLAMKKKLKWPMVFQKFKSTTETIQQEYYSIEEMRQDTIHLCQIGHIDWCEEHNSEDMKKCYIECISAISSLFFTTVSKQDIKKFDAMKYCSFCKSTSGEQWNELKICAGCKLAYYCSRRCQKWDWNQMSHKQFCVSMRQC